MKILHTADWHLGNTFHGYDRTAEHRHFLDWLTATLAERQPDVLIVAGDVFDTSNPSAASERLLFDFLLGATRADEGLQVVITAGNHDAAGRLDAPAELLKLHNIYVRGGIRRTPEGEPDFAHYLLPLSRRDTTEAEIVCIALPYLRSCDYPAGLSPEEGLRHYYTQCLHLLERSPFKGLPVVSAAHFYAAGADVCENGHSERLVVGGQDCVRADVAGRDVCYVALGHIHRAQRVGTAGEVHYAGSALPMSFAEKHYRHGAQWVEIDSEGRVAVSRLDYTPLRPLQSIPAQGAATPQEVLAALDALPRRRKDDGGDTWPYLEIRVAEQQPEPAFVADVARRIEDRAVRLCRIVRQLPDARRHEEKPSVELLRSVTPREMADSVFAARYGQPMPESMARRFALAEAAALAEPSGGTPATEATI